MYKIKHVLYLYHIILNSFYFSCCLSTIRSSHHSILSLDKSLIMNVSSDDLLVLFGLFPFTFNLNTRHVSSGDDDVGKVEACI